MPPEMPAPGSGLSGGQVGVLLVVLAGVIYRYRDVVIPAAVWLIVGLASCYACSLLGMDLFFRRPGDPPPFESATLVAGAIGFACLYYRKPGR